MNRKAARYLVAAVGLFALVVGQAAPASAVTIAYSQSTGWELGTATTELVTGMTPNAGGVEFFEPAFNPDPSLFALDNLPPANTYTTIGWGCATGAISSCAATGETVVATDPREATGRSALYLQGLAGTVSNDGVWVNISYVEQNNQVIRGRTLDSVDIESILRINTSPTGTADTDTIVTFFTETLNRAPCPVPNPEGSTCDDFFNFNADFTPVIITHDGISYTLEFRLANLVNATFDPITSTLFTAEGVTSSVNVQMRIAEVKSVPEPVTVILLGAGLIGFGVFATARRRNR